MVGECEGGATEIGEGEVEIVSELGLGVGCPDLGLGGSVLTGAALLAAFFLGTGAYANAQTPELQAQLFANILRPVPQGAVTIRRWKVASAASSRSRVIAGSAKAVAKASA